MTETFRESIRLEDLPSLLEAKVLSELLRIANDGVADMQAQFAEAKTGVIYGSHQASAPGEAPAIDTSNLASNITVSQTGPLEVTINIAAEYAAALEFGTVHMAARPFVTPAIEHTIRPELMAMKLDLER